MSIHMAIAIVQGFAFVLPVSHFTCVTLQLQGNATDLHDTNPTDCRHALAAERLTSPRRANGLVNHPPIIYNSNTRQ